MKHSEEAVISVIVPVYNTEEYVSEAIASIARQTYRRLDIILIDDGSTDGSLELCNEAARRDKRVRVIKQANAGVSAARNKGLDTAVGEYVVFVDSDDIIDTDMVQTLYHNTVSSASDISTCGYKRFATQTPTEPSRSNGKSKEVRLLSSSDAVLDILYAKGLITGNISGKMYKMSHIKNLRFNQAIYYAEDVLFNMATIADTAQVCTTSEPLYFYRTRPGSAMSASFSSRRMSALYAYESMQTIFNDRSTEVRAVRSRLFMEAISVLEAIPVAKAKEDAQTVWNIIKKLRKDILSDNNVRITYKIYGLISFLGITVLQQGISIIRSMRTNRA